MSKSERDRAIAAADRSRFLRLSLRVHLVMKPPTDHLGPVERMEVMDTYLQKVRSHCAMRKKATRRLFPCAFIAVREAEPETHMEEHLHMLVHVPDTAEGEHLMRLARGWCANAFAGWADDLERQRENGKVGSAIGYLLKAAHPRSVWADPTMMHKPSGAIAGWRVKITGNLTSPEAVKEAEIAVRAKERIRAERARVARWNRLHPASSRPAPS